MALVKYKPGAEPDRLTAEQAARLRAMSDADITRAAENDPDNPLLTQDEMERGLFGREVRRTRDATGLSQEQFAAALRLPVATLRNWEQGRVQPDPAARSLIAIVAADPARALKVLAA
jgi:putative transcriptional regulator